MAGEVTPRDVRAQLEKLRTAEPFASSPQLVNFLDYVVSETLAGRGRALKGYTIAVEALGRPEEFDPQSDPIVRVEARRLRQALRTYYEGPGREDAVRITIPTGSYIPQFLPAGAPHDADDGADEERSDPDEKTDRATPPPDAQPPDAPAVEPTTIAPLGPRRRPPSPSPTASPPPQPEAVDRSGWSTLIAIAAAALLALAVGHIIRGYQERAALAVRIAAGHGADLREVRLPVVRLGLIEAVGPDDPPAATARRLAERISFALSRFDEIRVRSIASAEAFDPTGDYLLRGRLLQRPDGGFSLGLILQAPVSRDALLTREYPRFQPDEARAPDPSAATEEQVVREIATEIGRLGGVIAADQLTRLARDSTEQGRCLFSAISYWRAPTRARHAEARACLKGVIATSHPLALAQANLAFLALDEYRSDYNPEPGPPPLDRALDYARSAVALAPSSARAQQALMDALFVRGQTAEALAAGERALILNPYDVDILADYGARLVQSGRVEEGREKLVAAAAALPVRPPWHDFHLVLSAAYLGQRQAAAAHAEQITSDADPLSLIARIIGAQARDAPEQAEALGRRLTALDIRYRTDPRGLIARRMLAPPILDFVVAAVAAATPGGRSESESPRIGGG